MRHRPTTASIRSLPSTSLDLVAGGSELDNDPSLSFDVAPAASYETASASYETASASYETASPSYETASASYETASPSNETASAFEPASPAAPLSQDFTTSPEHFTPMPEPHSVEAPASSGPTPWLPLGPAERLDPAAFRYLADGTAVDPAHPPAGQRTYPLETMTMKGEIPSYLQPSVDPVTGERYNQLTAKSDPRFVPNHVRIIGGSVAGIAISEAANAALPYAKEFVDGLEQSGHAATAAVLRETGNIARDALIAASPIGVGTSWALQYLGVSPRYADWAGIGVDTAARVLPTGVIYNPISAALGVSYAAVQAGGRYAEANSPPRSVGGLTVP